MVYLGVSLSCHPGATMLEGNTACFMSQYVEHLNNIILYNKIQDYLVKFIMFSFIVTVLKVFEQMMITSV